MLLYTLSPYLLDHCSLARVGLLREAVRGGHRGMEVRAGRIDINRPRVRHARVLVAVLSVQVPLLLAEPDVVLGTHREGVPALDRLPDELARHLRRHPSLSLSPLPPLLASPPPPPAPANNRIEISIVTTHPGPIFI